MVATRHRRLGRLARHSLEIAFAGDDVDTSLPVHNYYTMELVVWHFHPVRSSGVPVYLQLVQQVEQAVRSGRLAAGDQLPTARDVVSSLAINPNTVLKAYRQLEMQGITEGRPGVGTFVLASPSLLATAAYPAQEKRLRQWVMSSRASGLSDDDMRALLDTVLVDTATAETA